MATAHESENTGFKQDVQRLGQGVGTLTADVRHVAHGAADVVRSGATEIRQGAQHAVEVAKEKFDDAKDGAAHAADSVKHAIERNPMAAVGIAAGIGLVVGLILFRPRS